MQDEIVADVVGKLNFQGNDVTEMFWVKQLLHDIHQSLTMMMMCVENLLFVHYKASEKAIK